MKRVLIALTALLLLSGCASTPQSNSEFSSADIMFAEMMIPHHEQAIEMSELALLNTSNAQVLDIANQIKNAQTPEIELMKSWTGVKASMHAGHVMDGMLSQDELTELMKATGKEFDLLFLQGMIKHHEGAIEMAKGVINSKTKVVADLGASIIKAQEIEIAKMKELLLNA
jgi:uncharacterized protein (DUF305 family)